MKKFNRSIVIAFSALYSLFFCCGMVAGQVAGQVGQAGQIEPQFKTVTVPGVLFTAEDRAGYLVSHYWDLFDFRDTTFLQSKTLDRAFVNYVSVLPYATKLDLNVVLTDLMDRAAVDKAMYVRFLELSKRYLYSPESNFVNEEFFIPILEHAVKGRLLNSTEKINHRYTLGLVKKNRIGTPASDFSFTLANGRTSSLYRQEAETIILMFYNPGCHGCKITIDEIKRSAVIQNAFRKGTVKIVAVYPDQDLTEWKKYLNDIPESWVNGYNKGVHIRENELYDLKAIPMMYLLDKSKKIIMKDALVKDIEGYLSRL